MSLGPGKYDYLCEEIIERTKCKSVFIIVVDGDQGSGISAKTHATILDIMPGILRNVATQLEKDMKEIN